MHLSPLLPLPPLPPSSPPPFAEASPSAKFQHPDGRDRWAGPQFHLSPKGDTQLCESRDDKGKGTKVYIGGGGEPDAETNKEDLDRKTEGWLGVSGGGNWVRQGETWGPSLLCMPHRGHSCFQKTFLTTKIAVPLT